jgi:hypothetical protein
MVDPHNKCRRFFLSTDWRVLNGKRGAVYLEYVHGSGKSRTWTYKCVVCKLRETLTEHVANTLGADRLPRGHRHVATWFPRDRNFQRYVQGGGTPPHWGGSTVCAALKDQFL